MYELSAATLKRFNSKPIFLVAALFIFSYESFGQTQSCEAADLHFKSGEKITYNVRYNWGFIWVDAGFVTFKVSEVPNNNTLLRLSANGYSLKKWDWIYKVRDTFIAEVSKDGFKVLRSERNTSEGKYKVKNKYWFNHQTNKIKTSSWNSKKEEVNSVHDFPNCTYDVLSMVYAARNLNYASRSVGEKIPISLIIDDAVYPDLYIRYMGEERIETGGVTYNCFKLKPYLVEGTIFGEGEDMTVWVINDKHRVPVLIEAKIIVGSVKAILNSKEGLK